MSNPIKIEFSLNCDVFNKQIKLKTQNCGKFDVLIVTDVPYIAKGFELLSQDWFKSKISLLPDLIGINLKVNENIYEKLNTKHQVLEFKNKNAFFLTLQSIRGKHESKTYWKLAKCKNVYSLFIDDDDTEDVTTFFHEFLANELKNGHSGVIEYFQKRDRIRLKEIGDNEGRNLLENAIHKMRINSVKSLLQHEFDPDDVIDQAWKIFEDATDVDSKRVITSIILLLLNANSRLPVNFDYGKAPMAIKTFIIKCECLHRAIDANAFDLMKSKIEASPSLIHFYDRNNQSLLAHALKAGKWKIINYLKMGISTGSHEELQKVYENMTKNEFRLLRDQHKVNAKENSDKHIYILRSKSKIGNNDPFSLTKWKFINEVYANLNKNEYCKKILKIAAECKQLRIYFDFKHDSTYYMDPATSIYSKGIIYGNGSIFIGAKNLTDNDRKYEVFGVLAHELCHLAVYMAFMNREFDPFPIGDSKEKKRFIEQVMTQCKRYQKCEQTVKNVFESYAEHLRTSEMIVTVPQMQMQYLKNDRKLRKNRITFKNLFKYSIDVVEPELERALPVLKLLSNESQSLTFNGLTQPMKAKILHSKINFQGLETSLFELIGSDQKILKLLTPKNICDVLTRNKTLEIGKGCEQTSKYGLTQRSFIEIGTCKTIQNSYQLHTHDEIEIKYRAFSNTFNDIKNEVEKSKIFLLADHAGTGKTTIFQDISIRLKNEYNNFWVSCINLRKHVKIFDEFNDLAENLNIEEVLKILLKIIDKTSEIDANIFSKLFYEGKTILLFEGVDEISPKHTKLLTNALFVLKEFKIKNQLWISTRPHLAKILRKMLNCQAYQFAPYTRKEKEKFIKNILETKDINDPKKEDKIVGEINHYILQRQLSTTRSHGIDNSLMITIITELHIQNAIDVNTSSNYGIYLAMFKKQVQEVDEKIPVNERNPIESFLILKVHQVLALYLIIGDDVPNFKLDDLVIIKEWKSLNEKSPDKIQRYGFVTVDMENPDERSSIDFIHRTYAEFFVAMFVICSVFDDNHGDRDEEIERKFELLKIILKGSWNYFLMVRNFILSYIKNEAKGKSFHKKIKSLLIQQFPVVQNSYDQIRNIDFENYANFCQIDNELLRKLWQVDEEDNILLKCVNKNIFRKYSNVTYQSEISFGPNWHELFNKSGKKLISDEEIEDKYRNDVKGDLWNYLKGLLKFCDLVDQNFKKDEKVKFYNSIDLLDFEEKNLCKEILLRMAKHAELSRIVDECFRGFSDFELLKFFANVIKQSANFDNSEVKLKLHRFIPSIYLVVCNANESGRYEILRQFLTEFYTRTEIQEILIKSEKIRFFEGCENTFYSEYKKFIKNIFKLNGIFKIANKIENNMILLFQSGDIVVTENARDFVCLIFAKRKSKIKKVLKQIIVYDRLNRSIQYVNLLKV